MPEVKPTLVPKSAEPIIVILPPASLVDQFTVLDRLGIASKNNIIIKAAEEEIMLGSEGCGTLNKASGCCKFYSDGTKWILAG